MPTLCAALLFRAALVLTGARAEPAGLVVLPPRIDTVLADPSQTIEVALAVTNPSDQSVEVSFQVQYAGPRPRECPKPPIAPVHGAAQGPPRMAACPGLHRLIVSLRGDHGDAKAVAARIMGDATLGIQSWVELPHLGLHIAELGCQAGGHSAREIAELMKRKYGDAIESVEVDAELVAQQDADCQKMDWNKTAAPGGPNDPAWYLQWGMHRTKVQAAWERLAAANLAPQETVIAVIDSGVNYHHEDLKEHIWTNPCEIPGNGVDDDNNGYVDDVYGWNFVDGNNDTFDRTNGHGTHCAGIIAAAANNSKGIAGVAGWHGRVKVMALKVLNKVNHGNHTNFMLALEYALNMGVPISSNSYSLKAIDRWYYDSYSMQAALDKAEAAGHLFVCAAGNYGLVVEERYPCADRHTLCVANMEKERLAAKSNWGPKHVQVAAPGQCIYSSYKPDNNTYEFDSGTSMASPLVAGAAALIQSNFPYLRPLQIGQWVLDTVEEVQWLKDKVSSNGSLDVASLVERAEESLWVRLGTSSSPADGTRQKVTALLQPKATLQLAVQVGGFGGLPEGTSSAEIVVTTSTGNASVPVHLQVPSGPPVFAADWVGRDFVLNLGSYNIGRPSDAVLVHFHNMGHRMLRVRSSSPPFPFSILGQTSVEVGPNSSGSFKYQCIPSKAGEQLAGITLHTNSGVDKSQAAGRDPMEVGATYHFKLNCTGVPRSSKPVIALVLDMGSMDVGRPTKSVSLPFQNVGEGILHVRSDEPPAPFSIDGQSFIEVLPGFRGSISYRCRPTKVGEQVGIVTLHTNSAVGTSEGGDQYRIYLNCTGLQPPWRPQTLQATPGIQAAFLGAGVVTLASLWQWRRRASATRQGTLLSSAGWEEGGAGGE